MAADWPIRPLGEIAVFKNRLRVPLSAAQRAERPGPFPYWGANGPLDTIDDYLFHEPNVLVAEDGTVIRADGRAVVHWVQGKYWVNNHAHVLGAGDDHSLRWLYYALLSAQVRSLVSGSVQPKLSMGSLRRLPLRVPGLHEQEAIVSVLEALDHKIESNLRLRHGALRLLEARFIELLGGRTPRIPIGNIAEVVRDPTSPSADPLEVFEQFSIPAHDLAQGPEVCLGQSMASAKTRMPADAVLVSKLNPATKRVWWPERIGVGRPVCSPEFVALRPTSAPASWLFACAAFDTVFYEQVLGGVTGTTGSRQRVKPADVLAATVPGGSPEHIAEWDAVARPFLDRNVSFLRENRYLGALRDALLPKLVFGQIRVPLSDDLEEQVGAAVEALT